MFFKWWIPGLGQREHKWAFTLGESKKVLKKRKGHARGMQKPCEGALTGQIWGNLSIQINNGINGSYIIK